MAAAEKEEEQAEAATPSVAEEAASPSLQVAAEVRGAAFPFDPEAELYGRPQGHFKPRWER